MGAEVGREPETQISFKQAHATLVHDEAAHNTAFTWSIGDKDKTEAMPAGTYGTWPAGMKHYVWIKGETVLQFHGIGPWTIQYVNAADDPRNQK